MSLAVFIIGFLTGIGALKVFELFKLKKLDWKWFHWAIAVAWYFMVLFVALFVAISFQEGQPQAAGMATLIFGGTALVISVLLYRFVYAKKTNKIVAEQNLNA